MTPKVIEVQPMQSMSKFRVKFEHCGGSYHSTGIYKCAPAKRITRYGSVFRALKYFHNVFTNADHLPRLSL